MSRRKRASMREGPLSDLFRSTTDEGSRPAGPDADEGVSEPALGFSPGEDAPAAQPEGRKTDAAAASDTPSSTPPAGEDSKSSSEPSAPEKLKKVFAEEPAPRLNSPAKRRGMGGRNRSMSRREAASRTSR